MGETQFSRFIAPNLESENPDPLLVAECSYVVRTLACSENPRPLPVAVLAASLVCEKWQSLACVILASHLPSELPVA